MDPSTDPTAFLDHPAPGERALSSLASPFGALDIFVQEEVAHVHVRPALVDSTDTEAERAYQLVVTLRSGLQVTAAAAFTSKAEAARAAYGLMGVDYYT